MKRHLTLLTLLTIAPAAMPAAPASALEAKAGPEQATKGKRIEDNSFLIEEAYNQEDRVVQHIQAFQFLSDKTWLYTFTQEWPIFGQAHQLSFTVPLLRPDALVSGKVGDILVNYRYQLVRDEAVAFAPRLTLVTPTGDSRNGYGNGAFGFETNLPLSATLSRYFVMHWNLGARVTPSATSTAGSTATPLSFNYGASLVWLAREKLNFLVELAGASTATVDPSGGIKRQESFFVNPGVRGAVSFGEVEMVPGVAIPIGVGPSSGTYGVFGYLSFEHPY